MFWLHLVVDHFHYYISVSVLKRKCQIKLFTFDILNAWVTFKCVEHREN